MLSINHKKEILLGLLLLALFYPPPCLGLTILTTETEPNTTPPPMPDTPSGDLMDATLTGIPVAQEEESDSVVRFVEDLYWDVSQQQEIEAIEDKYKDRITQFPLATREILGQALSAVWGVQILELQRHIENIRKVREAIGTVYVTLNGDDAR